MAPKIPNFLKPTKQPHLLGGPRGAVSCSPPRVLLTSSSSSHPYKVGEEGFVMPVFLPHRILGKVRCLPQSTNRPRKELGRKPPWPAPRHFLLPPRCLGTRNKEKNTHTRTELWENEACFGVSVLSDHGAASPPDTVKFNFYFIYLFIIRFYLFI